MRPIQKKQKGLSELPLFRSFILFLKDLYSVLKNIDKDLKITYGYELLRDTKKAISAIRKSYRITKPVGKLEQCNIAFDLVDDIELTLKIFFELGVIASKQTAKLSIKIADVKTQLEGWKISLEKRAASESNNKTGDEPMD